MAVLHMLGSVTDTICESFIFEENGRLLVIDGGFESEAENLFAAIQALGGQVAGWFITHPHADHMGACCRLLEEHGTELRVEAVYTCFLDETLLCDMEPGQAEYTRLYLPWLQTLIRRHGIRHVRMRRGDVYPFGDAAVRVLREPDPAITVNCINNSSTVFRLDAGGQRLLFLGDLGVEGGHQLLAQTSPEELRADFVQMSHHGQHGVDRPVYEVIRPRCCLWCTPTWLWDNLGPDGYDSGIYGTVIVRGWMSDIGVRRHYVSMNGPHAIAL